MAIVMLSASLLSELRYIVCRDGLMILALHVFAAVACIVYTPTPKKFEEFWHSAIRWNNQWVLMEGGNWWLNTGQVPKLMTLELVTNDWTTVPVSHRVYRECTTHVYLYHTSPTFVPHLPLCLSLSTMYIRSTFMIFILWQWEFKVFNVHWRSLKSHFWPQGRMMSTLTRLSSPEEGDLRQMGKNIM